jgi:hypothetical protein
MDIMLVQAELGALHDPVNGAGGDTDLFVDKYGGNVAIVGFKWGPIKEDSVLVLADADGVLLSAVDSKVSEKLVV